MTMRQFVTYFTSFLISVVAFAQTEVDLSQLAFERTSNKSAVYTQYSAKTKLSASASSKNQIILDLGAGSAEVVQSQDGRLKAKAEIVLSVKNKNRISKELEDLELYIEEDGESLKLVSTFDYQESNRKEISGGFFSSPERKVNIKVYVPQNIKVRLKDRSGDLEINGISNDLQVSDGSGAIRIDNLNGNLDLKDNSGEISIANMNQNADPGEFTVRVRDSSGGIYLKDINGDTEIDDSSGDIEVTNIGGKLTIDDTSGSIVAKNIGGDSKVVDTSGEISVYSVQGSVTIYDTSGGIYVDTVTEDVTLKRDGSGSFVTKNIEGKIVKRG